MGGRDLLARKKHGEVFPAEIPLNPSLNPVETPDGIVVLASIIDLTERKKSVTTILEQAKQLEAAIAFYQNRLPRIASPTSPTVAACILNWKRC
jgi:hypothetical protein